MENAKNMEIIFNQSHISNLILKELNGTSDLDSLSKTCKFFYVLINNLEIHKHVDEENAFYKVRSFNKNDELVFLTSNYNRSTPLRYYEFDYEIKHLKRVTKESQKFGNEIVIIIDVNIDILSLNDVQRLISETSLFIDSLFDYFINANILTLSLSTAGKNTFVIGRIIMKLKNNKIDKIKLFGEDILKIFDDFDDALYKHTFNNLSNFKELKICGFTNIDLSRRKKDFTKFMKNIFQSLSIKQKFVLNLENLHHLTPYTLLYTLISLSERFHIEYRTSKLIYNPLKRIMTKLLPIYGNVPITMNYLIAVKLYIGNVKKMSSYIKFLAFQNNVRSIEFTISVNLINSFLRMPIKKLQEMLYNRTYKSISLRHLKYLRTISFIFEDKLTFYNLKCNHGIYYGFIKKEIFKSVLFTLPNTITKLRIYNFDEIDCEFSEFLDIMQPNITLLMISFTRIKDKKCLTRLKNINYLFIEGYQLIKLPLKIKFFIMSMSISANKFIKKMNFFFQLSDHDVDELYKIYSQQFLNSVIAKNNRFAFFYDSNCNWKEYIKAIQYFLEHTGTVVFHTVS